MSVNHAAIDRTLAAVLRGDRAVDAGLFAPAALIERIDFHGIAGLLAETPDVVASWPDEVRTALRASAIVGTMWELRHRQVVTEMLAALASVGVAAILLKGTAMAYDLYSSPATRTRGDSDVLVDPRQIDEARQIMKRLGFERLGGDSADEIFSLQEVWRLNCEGAVGHDIDLHWQLLNAPALKDLLPITECFADPHPLPQLSPDAMSMDRVKTLIHTCVHRSINFTWPYFVA